jgi:hypothetical protein
MHVFVERRSSSIYGRTCQSSRGPSCAKGAQISHDRSEISEGGGVLLRSQHVTFDELSEQLRTHERRYEYSTIQFYRRYRDGELGDDDDLMLWPVSTTCI